MNLVIEEESFIEDEAGNRLFYAFSPAEMISNFVPLVVLLHEKKQRVHFSHKMWNVLTPLDFDGSSAHEALLQELVEALMLEYDCDEHLYFYGKGKGAFDAVLQGSLSGANAVYALGLETTQEQSARFTQKTMQRKNLPIVYLCGAGDTAQNSGLIDVLGAKTVVDKAHCFDRENEEERIKAALSFLEKMASQR